MSESKKFKSPFPSSRPAVAFRPPTTPTPAQPTIASVLDPKALAEVLKAVYDPADDLIGDYVDWLESRDGKAPTPSRPRPADDIVPRPAADDAEAAEAVTLLPDDAVAAMPAATTGASVAVVTADDEAPPGARLTDPVQIREFVTAGKCKIVLVSERTGTGLPYRVFSSKDGDVHFVAARRAAGGYEVFALIRDRREFEFLRGKARVAGYTEASEAVAAFRWMWDAIAAGAMPRRMEVWHAGECAACGKALTQPESIKRGWGPECWRRIAPRLRCDPARAGVPPAQGVRPLAA